MTQLCEPAVDDFRERLNDYRTRVDDALRDALARAGDAPAQLLKAMRYSLLAPGKRLRPLLVVLAAEACGGTPEQALPAGCAVEMVHTYSLIHDDLPAMDNDDLRRGLPTCHKQFGEALAILAGDALLTLAFQVLSESYPPTTAAVACLELARGAGAAGMVGGQVEDLAWEKCLVRGDPNGTAEAPEPKLADLENIHARKTGALFRACLRLGYRAACGEDRGRGDDSRLRCLDEYGRCFGQLFQITDDLLDVEGTAEQTGKRVQKDAARGKLTYPSLLGATESRRRGAALAAAAREAAGELGPAGGRLAALIQLIQDRDR
jgi:geranylgeranyl diphosphate synthase type II